jgi:hypothetical protein
MSLIISRNCRADTIKARLAALISKATNASSRHLRAECRSNVKSGPAMTTRRKRHDVVRLELARVGINPIEELSDFNPLNGAGGIEGCEDGRSADLLHPGILLALGGKALPASGRHIPRQSPARGASLHLHAAQTVGVFVLHWIGLDQKRSFLLVHFRPLPLARCGDRAFYKLCGESRASSFSSGNGYARLKWCAGGLSKILSPF